MKARFEFARRAPGRPPLQILWYDCCEKLCRWSLKLVYRLRIEGEEQVPDTGAVLFISNHQSFLDPVLNGIPLVDRQLRAMARESLFRFWPLAWLMRSYGAIPIREDSGDVGAMKAALAELAAGRSVLVYPEGSRSDDGAVAPFKRGIGLLIRKAGVTVVPMAIEGATDVWPPTRKFPRLRGRLGVKVGEPIAFQELMAEGSEAALERLRREVERLRLDLRRDIREDTGGRWPKAGPDRPFWSETAAADAS